LSFDGSQGSSNRPSDGVVMMVIVRCETNSHVDGPCWQKALRDSFFIHGSSNTDAQFTDDVLPPVKTGRRDDPRSRPEVEISTRWLLPGLGVLPTRPFQRHDDSHVETSQTFADFSAWSKDLSLIHLGGDDLEILLLLLVVLFFAPVLSSRGLGNYK